MVDVAKKRDRNGSSCHCELVAASVYILFSSTIPCIGFWSGVTIDTEKKEGSQIEGQARNLQIICTTLIS